MREMQPTSPALCGDCTHLVMQYDRNDWEIYGCEYRGEAEPERTACPCFEWDKERREEMKTEYPGYVADVDNYYGFDYDD